MTEPKPITYTSDNGFTGTLYGFSSLSITDRDGNEKMHTGFRSINTTEELKTFVDAFPETLKQLNNILPKTINENKTYKPVADKENNAWLIYNIEHDFYIRLPKEIEDEIKHMMGPKLSKLEEAILWREINKDADWLHNENLYIVDVI